MPESQLNVSAEIAEPGVIREFYQRLIQRCSLTQRKAEFRAYFYEILDGLISITIIAIGVYIATIATEVDLTLGVYISFVGSLVSILQFLKSVFKLESSGRRYRRLGARVNDLSLKLIEIETGQSHRAVEEIVRLSKEFDDIELKAFDYGTLHQEMAQLQVDLENSRRVSEPSRVEGEMELMSDIPLHGRERSRLSEV